MASRRRYLSEDELEEYADITVTDSAEGFDRISMAEELVDAYVGFQPKFLDYVIDGMISVGGSDGFTLEDIHINTFDVDYLKGCEIEILGGPGVGERHIITGQTHEGVITVDTSFTTPLTTASFYRIYQLGKFPRKCDVTSYSRTSPTTYYKQIPENIKRATAAQVQYMIDMGDSFFSTDKSEFTGESIGDYSYTKSGGNGKTIDQLIAPKAKEYLRGIRNRKGVIIE